MFNQKIIEELKNNLTDYVNQVTEKDDHINGMYKCPLCESGTHGRASTGAFSVDRKNPTQWKCFACQQGGDIFDLVGKIEHIEDYTEKVKRIASIYNVNESDLYTNAQLDVKSTNVAKTKEKEPLRSNKKDLYKDYIEKCAKDITQTSYFTNRGLPQEAQAMFNLGYDKNKYCVVIPYGKDNSYYITRAVNKKQFNKPNSSEAGSEPVYNQELLEDLQTPCFVCESPIDAMSIIYASNYKYNAVAVGGTGIRKLTSYLKSNDLKPRLIINLDNDEPGRSGTAEAEKELKQINVPFITAKYDYKAYCKPGMATKDANDLLQANLSQFKSDIESNAQLVLKVANEEQERLLEGLNRFKASNLLKDLVNSIANGKGSHYIPTGFELLDKELDGGLYSGLYVLGALSSLGKTTLMLQIADQIAMQGQDVLYFSLEMSAEELIAKSVSRLTYQATKPYTNNAKTTRGILTASRYAHYSKEEKQLIANSMNKYREFANNMYIYEGVGNIGVNEIKNALNDFVKATGKTPVIFIDYLQILAPYDIKASDKQNTDKAILELKRLSRDYDTPVMAISSFNRENYTTEVNIGAFKESGTIEYSSDVALAIQPQHMKQGYNNTEKAENQQRVKTCKHMRVRPIEVAILKNRNGRTGSKLGFNYYTLFNCYEQDKNYKPREEKEQDEQ